MEKLVGSINQMYPEMMMTMRMQGVRHASQRGTVLSLEHPLLVSVQNPTQRVLLDKTRLCNPFFHVAEAVWMMAGLKSTKWLSHFNKGITEYADDDGTINGAYGYRWRNHWAMDQLWTCVGLLRADNSSRRAVLQMWDPQSDLDVSHNDIPCNTSIFFRVIWGALEATVCNRSNDVIWGMTGANAVHLTILQELMARELGLEVGAYHVMTNNAHVYTDLPNVGAMLQTTQPVYHEHTPLPLLGRRESLQDFITDCTLLVMGREDVRTYWMQNVALPMTDIYLKQRNANVNEIGCPQWKRAAQEWLMIKR